MAVRVSKPAFNLREKLSELDVPIGTHGSQLMKSSTTEETFNLVKAGRKNLIINGAMFVNQRNATSSVTMPHATGGTYQLDRWAINEATGGSVSVNMDGDPQNYYEVEQFERCMQIACASDNSSLSSTENLHFFQNIEANNMCHLGWGTQNAKPVTLSFWVKTNCAGVYNVGLENRNTDRTCIRTFYQNGMHTWNKVVLHYSGCADGTWNYGTNTGLRVRFCLASGTQYDDGVEGEWVHSDELTAGTQVNFMSSTNNRFMITGVQLEEGNSATPFEHRSYGEETALCQRYYQKIDGASDLTPFGYGRANGSQTVEAAVPLTVPLRASPALSCSHNTAWGPSSANTSTTAPSVGRWIKDAVILHVTFGGHSGLTNARATNVHCGSNSNFEMDAEI
tara:strand:- start:153 stop:1334 length:1182 start_codon:yes stop_codon:yes gene_type:complete